MYFKDIKYKTLLTELHKYQIEKLNNLIVDWCILTFGIRKYCPNISITNVKDRKDPSYASYDIDRHQPEIIINITTTINVQNLIDSVIHEYGHYLETNFAKRYEKYGKKYDYEHHPLEIKACKFAKKYRRKCFQEIKSKF